MSNLIPSRNANAVRARSGGICERCGSASATDMAHRVRRANRDHGPSNIAHLCHGCHMWSHAHPKDARNDGWIVLANGRIRPGDMFIIPVRTLRDGWFRFTVTEEDEGTIRSDRIGVSAAIAISVLHSYGLREVPF